MTPERLDEIREQAENPLAFMVTATADAQDRRMVKYANSMTDSVADLLEYIDLLHEDLRITRQERDHAKHQALEHRKHSARLERERDEYRRGQGRAPAEQGPGTDALHHAHPIPDSRGEDQ